MKISTIVSKEEASASEETQHLLGASVPCKIAHKFARESFYQNCCICAVTRHACNHHRQFCFFHDDLYAVAEKLERGSSTNVARPRRYDHVGRPIYLRTHC